MKDKKFAGIIVLCLVGLTMVVYSLIIIGHTIGYRQGFEACIEENNLYERYDK